jgi:tetratricopeptide (TPR) repeat protein
MRLINLTVVFLLFAFPVFAQNDSEPIYHAVEAKEGLWGIAQRSGTTVEQVKIWNHLPNNNISIGQKLIVGYKTKSPIVNKTEEVIPVDNTSNEKDALYDSKLDKADKALDAGNFREAKRLYSEALALFPEEKYPTEKIKDIELLLAKQEADRQALKNKEQTDEIDRRYAQSLKSGDLFFDAENFSEAKKQYEQAISLKPNEVYPKEKIAAINKLLSDEAQFKLFIQKGNESYNLGDLVAAKDFFTQALQIKPKEEYAQHMLDIIEQDNLKKPKLSDDYTKTWWVEVAYVLVPNSISNGVELHGDFPLRKYKSDKRIFPTLGIGGGYIYKLEKNHQFPEVKTDVKISRYYGEAVFGVRFLVKGIGFAPRIGYNYTRQQYDYNNISNCEDCKEKMESNLHRLSGEFYVHVPFSRKNSNFGFLAGCKYLYHPKKSDSNLFVVKVGFTF